jgi:hypothetical protein
MYCNMYVFYNHFCCIILLYSVHNHIQLIGSCSSGVQVICVICLNIDMHVTSCDYYILNYQHFKLIINLLWTLNRHNICQFSLKLLTLKVISIQLLFLFSVVDSKTIDILAHLVLLLYKLGDLEGVCQTSCLY